MQASSLEQHRSKTWAEFSLWSSSKYLFKPKYGAKVYQSGCRLELPTHGALQAGARVGFHQARCAAWPVGGESACPPTSSSSSFVMYWPTVVYGSAVDSALLRLHLTSPPSLPSTPLETGYPYAVHQTPLLGTATLLINLLLWSNRFMGGGLIPDRESG